MAFPAQFGAPHGVGGGGPSTAEQGLCQKPLATAASGIRHRMPYLESEKVRFIFDKEQK
jgi:hypothetical protein